MTTASVLFVDDEPLLLQAIRRMLHGQRDWLTPKFAKSGEEALQLMEEVEIDVIVSDMRMPGMSGADLLAHTAERWPEAMRIVLSGHAELDAALRAISVAHHFVTKPASRDELLRVIKDSLELREIIEDDDLRHLVGSVQTLPSRPELYSKICSLAGAGGSLGQVAVMLESDVAISAKIIQVANSSFYSRGVEIKSVAQAVPRLGFEVVKGLVLATETYGRVPSEHRAAVSALADHSLEVAYIAQRLVRSKEQVDYAFTAGLLHDIGRLLELDGTWTEGDPAHHFTHSDVGAYLLHLWGIPSRIVDAVAFHHVPPQGADTELSDAVRIAEFVSECESTREDFIESHGDDAWRGFLPALSLAFDYREEHRSA